MPAAAATLHATQATLSAALRTARPGDEIRVSGQITGPINANFAAPGVTLAAEPGASLGPDPRSRWFAVQGSGMTFRGFAVVSGGGASIGVCCGSSRIGFDRLDFTGLGAIEQGGGSGLMARDATDISVTNSRFRGASAGMSFNNVSRGTVVGDDFQDLWQDAIKIATTGDVLVEKNTFTNFRGPALHLDAIQLIGADRTKPVRGVRILNNRYTRGVGTPAQFIFVSDSAAGYNELTIRGNSGWGSAWHCITVVKPSAALIEDNFCQGSTAKWDGQLLVPWVRTDSPGADVIVRANVLPPPSGEPKALSAWLQRSATAVAESRPASSDPRRRRRDQRQR